MTSKVGFYPGEHAEETDWALVRIHSRMWPSDHPMTDVPPKFAPGSGIYEPELVIRDIAVLSVEHINDFISFKIKIYSC